MTEFNPNNFSDLKADTLTYEKEQSFISKVFNWMFLGLMSTGITAWIVSSNPIFIQAIFSNSFVSFGLVIGLFALVWNLSANLHKMSYQSASLNFFIYSALNGVLLSSIFIVYTTESIFSTFLVAGASFGITALYGATTKRDLTKMGSFMFMALTGLIIAYLVSIGMKSSGLESILNYAGVLIFVGLTAYDMQKIKEIGNEGAYHPNLSIIGALRLYLDFINLFLFLLKIIGRRK
jgi:uncharacterized protein